MTRLTHWIKRNTEMTLTILSGCLILLGIYLNAHSQGPLVALSNDMETPLSAVIAFIAAFIVGGHSNAIEGFKELFVERKLTIDLLMFLAAVGASVIGYWMEGALLIFIFSLADSLETMAQAKSRNAISALMRLTPDQARKYQLDGSLSLVATADLRVGDHIQVPRGEAVPIDGELLSAQAVVNESAITGESIPVDKIAGDPIIGGTINDAESFDMTVTVENHDTLFAKIIKMVDDAQSNPTRAGTFIEKFEQKYVLAIIIAVPTFILGAHYLAGWTWLNAFYRGMVLLTVASPCALVASATPATLSAISNGAKNGMIFKGGDVVENIDRLQAIVFDKTGTLTLGHPEVENAFYRVGEDQKMINQVVKAAEFGSTHPIATAITSFLHETDNIQLDKIQDLTGKGFQINHRGDTWKIGKRSFALCSDAITLNEDEIALTQKMEAQGKTVIFVTRNHQFMAYFALADQLKASSVKAIKSLNELGITTVMITGDNQRTAEHIAELVGIQRVYANRLPDEKSHLIEELQEEFETVGMVGDGINDAPALALADVGFSMGSGTDIAMETADVVLVNDDLEQIPYSLGLAKNTQKIIKQNVIFSVSMILILILLSLFQTINLPLGVIGHEGSTILVILNGLRLLGYK